MGSNKNSPQKGEHNDSLFLFLCFGLGLGFIFKIVVPKVVAAFWRHPISYSVSSVAIVLFLCAISYVFFRNKEIDGEEVQGITSQDPGSVLLGTEYQTEKPIFLKESFRTMHAQVIGTTNAGKTGSVILPWAVSDINEGRGFLIIDGKSDMTLLKTLYGYAKAAGREKDFLVFSLCQPEISSTYNPFYGGTAEQITERIFSAFPFNEEYYKNIQFLALRTMTALILERKEVPVPCVVRELMRNKDFLVEKKTEVSPDLSRDIEAILAEPKESYLEKHSGLVTSLGHFSQGLTMPLFNTQNPEIILSECLKKKKLVFFQLPTMQFPFLGQATGKLLLQNLQSAVSELQTEGTRLDRLFSIYLDDFNDYIYPGFISLLNKSRSANVGVVFSHQSLGDLEKVSPDFKQVVLTNTNVKVIMRSNDPESAEYFSRTIGTLTTEASTNRRTKTWLGSNETGEQSVREVEQYVYHPNIFKSELGLGEGIVIIPHPKGRLVKRIKFSTVPDLGGAVSLPLKDHPKIDFFPKLKTKKDEVKGERVLSGTNEDQKNSERKVA
jgi:hypothetical protein